MVFCQSCGFNCGEGSKFCPQCGTQLSQLNGVPGNVNSTVYGGNVTITNNFNNNMNNNTNTNNSTNTNTNNSTNTNNTNNINNLTNNNNETNQTIVETDYTPYHNGRWNRHKGWGRHQKQCRRGD